MGLFNKFKKSTNYAQEYKSAVENNDMAKMSIVLADWLDDGPKDANFGLAMVILTSIRGDVPFEEVAEIYNTSISQEPEDSSVFGWYNDTAIKLMEKRADEAIENDPDLAKLFKEDEKSGTCKSGGDDSGYAKEFLRLFKIADSGDDPLESVNALGEMLEILQNWIEKYPDDANMTCAYVIMKVGYLDDGEIETLIMRANSQKPIDESCHAELLEHMNRYVMMKKGN